MISIFKRSVILTVLMTLTLSSVALAALPANVSKMTATQFNAYLYAQVAASKLKVQSTPLPFNVDDLIKKGKYDLSKGDVLGSLVSFLFVLKVLDSKNQTANFYSAIELLATDYDPTHPDITPVLKQLGIMDSNGILIYNNPKITLPDVISFRPTQALLAGWGSNQVSKEAIAQLNQINQTFSDTFTDPKWGTLKVDYAP